MANDLDIGRFIEAIRSRPPLWDKLDPMHRHLDFTNGLWDAIAEEMGGILTVAELKQKWHNLRDCFRREVRTAQAGKKKRRWIYYNQLLFLLTPQFMSKISSKNNAKEITVQNAVLFPLKTETPDETFQFDLNNTDSSRSEFIETESVIQATQENVLSQEHSQTDIIRNESVIPVIRGAEGHVGYCRTQNKSDQASTQRAREFSGHSRVLTDNDDYHFAMSIIPHMRRVPLHRKLKMRIRISEVIAEESGYKTPS